jgi:hypothetical protein
VSQEKVPLGPVDGVGNFVFELTRVGNHRKDVRLARDTRARVDLNASWGVQRARCHDIVQHGGLHRARLRQCLALEGPLDVSKHVVRGDVVFRQEGLGAGVDLARGFAHDFARPANHCYQLCTLHNLVPAVELEAPLRVVVHQRHRVSWKRLLERSRGGQPPTLL